QNFLMDMGAAKRIARLALEGSVPSNGAEPSPLPRVIEIGAGTGQLTEALLELGADVTAIELDPEMVRVLQARPELANAHVIQHDALTFDYESYGGVSPWNATGNLPYNVATPLMIKLIEMPRGPQTIVVMIQKDVADRLVAKPSTPAYGSLSIAVQYAMEVERAFTLGPNVFYPRPKVDSTVVRMTRRAEPAVRVRSERRFMQVVRAGFAYRRKTLANSLSLALELSRTEVAAALERVGLDTEIRGEQLAIGDFAKLSDALEI
ncbi:MAG: ribosomal RNA small subunit methyltransferase A, partial [Candidatus Eremiobacteraeota bacterium]|nr:ribosomal RNA small subunit methyltransferase A [Candidatus Eremiobacteraeota bacterium]